MPSLDYAGELHFVDESNVEAFPDRQEEFIAVRGVRALSMLLTPTCNLNAEDYWLFSPLQSLGDNPQLKRDTMFSTSGGYSDHFGVYRSPRITEESFVSFHNIVSVPSQPFRPPSTINRVANLSKEAQMHLADRFASFGGRGWGYAVHDPVEYEGYYHCRICSRFYGIDHKVIYLRKGQNPPRCADCKAASSKQSGSWELLLKHKKSRKPIVDAVQAPAVSAEGNNFMWRVLKFWKR